MEIVEIFLEVEVLGCLQILNTIIKTDVLNGTTITNQLKRNVLQYYDMS